MQDVDIGGLRELAEKCKRSFAGLCSVDPDELLVLFSRLEVAESLRDQYATFLFGTNPSAAVSAIRSEGVKAGVESERKRCLKIIRNKMREPLESNAAVTHGQILACDGIIRAIRSAAPEEG